MHYLFKVFLNIPKYRFTPIWRELEVNQSQNAPIRLAKVECMNEDRSVKKLCDHVNGFPSVHLYHDSKFKEEFLLDLTYDLIFVWLKNMTKTYANGNITLVNSTLAKNQTELTKIDQLKTILEKQKEPSPDINPHGQIVHLTNDDFDKVRMQKVISRKQGIVRGLSCSMLRGVHIVNMYFYFRI